MKWQQKGDITLQSVSSCWSGYLKTSKIFIICATLIGNELTPFSDLLVERNHVEEAVWSVDHRDLRRVRKREVEWRIKLSWNAYDHKA